MATVLNRPEQQVILRVSWDTYERLLTEHEQSNGIRFTFDQGVLEIVVPSLEHETLNSRIETLVELLADEMEIDFERTRSTTFRRKDLEKGFEPDSSFYIRNVQRVRGKKQLDLRKDPPPDLVIEIDITNSCLDKLPIYSAVGVAEIWRYSGEGLTILRLDDHAYVRRPESLVLPNITASALNNFIRSGQQLKRSIWTKRVREWARAL